MESLQGATWEQAQDAYLMLAIDNPKTRKNYAIWLRQAREQLQAQRMDALTPMDLAGHRTWVNALDCAPNTRGNRLAAVRSFLRWSEIMGAHSLGGPVVAHLLKTPPRPVQRPYAILSDADVMRFLETCPRHYRLLCLLMLGCGLRVAEVCALQRDDWYPGRPPVLYVMGKGARARHVPVARDLAAALRRHLRRHRGGPMFTNMLGGPLLPSTVTAMVRRTATLAGMERTTPHSFRHTFAIRALRSGSDLIAISRVLGHAKVQTTMVYLDHLSSAELVRSIPPLPAGSLDMVR